MKPTDHLVLLLCLLPACSLAAPPRGRAQLGAYSTSLDGEVFTRVGAATGNLDVETAGQSDASFGPFLRAQLGLGPVDLELSGYRYAQSGDGTFAGNFLGTTFSGPVHTDFEIQDLKVLFGWEFVSTDPITAGVLLGLDLYAVDLFIQDQAFVAVTEDVDELIPVPVVGLRAMSRPIEPLTELGIGAQATGFGLSFGDFDASLLDLEGGLYYSPTDHVEVFLGYRYTMIRFDGTTDANEFVDADLSLSGPFFGVGATF